MKYKITLVEDDTLILELMTNFLNASVDFKVVHTFENGTSFQADLAVISRDTDLIILDFQLGDTTAEELMKQLKREFISIPVIVLTAHYNEALISYMVQMGVACYLPKYVKLAEFYLILKEVLMKGHYISKDQFPYLQEAIQHHRGEQISKQYDISTRELDIIYLLAKQCTAKEIGEKLFLATKTVENYKNTLFVKTETKNIVGLVLWAVQRKLIALDQFNSL
jgi:DNA-binding NarL/FixJ family response regulator